MSRVMVYARFIRDSTLSATPPGRTHLGPDLHTGEELRVRARVKGGARAIALATPLGALYSGACS
jgi:hypothetical protein